MAKASRIGADPGAGHVTYGDRMGPAALARTLGRLLDTNVARAARGSRPVPICVWGLHGIGKTAIVQDVVAARGWRFAYVAPAQFEEMGDLHGLPVLVEGSEARTVFAAPDWVPRDDGPGVLLLDDLNRADDRILRGLMQLFQTGGMFSWRLPPGWQVVATANPEGGAYSVTQMDDAMLTRLLHVTLELDVADWVAWARQRGLDPRGVAFVEQVPEVVTGRRTTPRSLVQFFEALADVPDLRAEEALVRTLAASTLDEVTVAAFLAHVRGRSTAALGPSDVLDAPDEATLDATLRPLLAPDAGDVRLDLLGTLVTRLGDHLLRGDYAPAPRHGENLERFLLHPRMPADLRLALHRRVMSSKQAAPKALLRRKAIAEKVLDAL
jgi:MoxR-like ATPase